MKKVIFDVDGVLLSEKRYFDVSALVLWEWYYSPKYMHLGEEPLHATVTDEEIAVLRARFWKDDEILSWLKHHGINNNWDMVHAHILVVLWLLMEQYTSGHGRMAHTSFRNYSEVMRLGDLLQGYALPTAAQVLQRLDETVPPEAVKDDVFICLGQAMTASLGTNAMDWAVLNSPLWMLHFYCFQDWYFGDSLFERTYGRPPYVPGKPGFLQREQPLGTVEGIRHMFQELKRRGYEIAIATGRSYIEMKIPFETYDWLREFDPFYISTETTVEEAEKALGLSLGKPNPFTYYVGAFGNDPALYGEYAAQPEKYKKGEYFVVGDSLADVWCAKAMGATMIATLTGLEGNEARALFEKEGVAFIVPSVEGILDILK